MATDYDAPRRSSEDEGSEDDGLRHVRSATAQGPSKQTEDEANLNEDLELPGADLSAESLTVHVVPAQADEFTCQRCFLLAHTSQRSSSGVDICRDCA